MTSEQNQPLRIYLIRHGETEWSISGRHTGMTDIALTPHGEEEARMLGDRIQQIDFAYVLTSPRQRARQTCEFAQLKTTPTIEPLLAEWSYGDFEGRTPAHIFETRPDWIIFRDGCPNGESPAEVSHRADQLIGNLRKLKGNIALFSHGHFGRVLGARWMGLSICQAQHLLLSTASISVLCYEHDRTDQPAIDLWNSTSCDPWNTPGFGRAAMKRRALDRWENEGGEIPTDKQGE